MLIDGRRAGREEPGGAGSAGAVRGCLGWERKGLLRTLRLGTLSLCVCPQVDGTARPARGAL